jgi:hypothetical protein
MIYVKLTFVKVVGFNKFVRNAQNSIDLTLIIIYNLYTIIRFVQASGLPDEQNTKYPPGPSVNLGATICFNFVISLLIILKLMILIRINETFSQLAELVIVCI